MTTETIAAIASGLTHAGIGIIRISGPDALQVGDRVVTLKNGKAIAAVPTHTVHYGLAHEGEEVLDEILAVVMRSPHSFSERAHGSFPGGSRYGSDPFAE